MPDDQLCETPHATVLPKRGSDDPDRAAGSARGARGLHHLAAPRMRAQPARPARAEASRASAGLGSGGCGSSTRPSAARSRRSASSISHQIPESSRRTATASPRASSRSSARFRALEPDDFCARRSAARSTITAAPVPARSTPRAPAGDARPPAAPRPSSCSKGRTRSPTASRRARALLATRPSPPSGPASSRSSPRSILEAGRLLADGGIWPVLGRLPAHCRVDERSELSSTCRMSTPSKFARQPACARPERLRLAAPARELRPALAARDRLCGAAAPAGSGAADPAGRAAADPARGRRRHPAARPPARRRAAADDRRSSARLSASRTQASRSASSGWPRRGSSSPAGRATTSSTRSRPTASTRFAAALERFLEE